MFDWYFVTYHFFAETLLLTSYFTCFSFIRKQLFPPAKLHFFYSTPYTGGTTEKFSSVTVFGCRNDCSKLYFHILDIGGFSSLFICAVVVFFASFFLHLPSMWQRRVQLSHPTVPLDHSWYSQLQKPRWTPSPVVFALVWMILKMLQSYALTLIFECCHQRPITIPVLMMLAYLVLADLFNQIFFVQHDLMGGLVMIVILIFLTITIISVFLSISRFAAVLLIPLLIWLLLAFLLNVSIVWLNRNQHTH